MLTSNSIQFQIKKYLKVFLCTASTIAQAVYGNQAISCNLDNRVHLPTHEINLKIMENISAYIAHKDYKMLVQEKLEYSMYKYGSNSQYQELMGYLSIYIYIKKILHEYLSVYLFEAFVKSTGGRP